MNRDLAEMALQDNIADENEAAPETVPVPRSLVPRLSQPQSCSTSTARCST